MIVCINCDVAYLLLFFFFQAEDGIRDPLVTGVQTCALPISVASAANRDQARRAWRAAVETLNRDAPGIFLFATSNVAAVHKRIADVTIRPDSWLALLRTWRIPADRLTDRDRVER